MTGRKISIGVSAVAATAAVCFLLYTSGRVAAAAIGPQPVSMNVKAPELDGKDWINSTPIRLKDRLGLVTVVHFWTYGCVNCKRNLPIYNRWHERFAPRKVAVIGVHTPEFEAEAIEANLARHSKLLHIEYPVLPDPGLVNWRRWNQQFWPTAYLIDRKGRVRYRWEGEMNYANLDGERRMTTLIEQLLEETP
jgi:thiol-disulfide isomerase/thioredoxin